MRRITLVNAFRYYMSHSTLTHAPHHTCKRVMSHKYNTWTRHYNTWTSHIIGISYVSGSAFRYPKSLVAPIHESRHTCDSVTSHKQMTWMRHVAGISYVSCSFFWYHMNHVTHTNDIHFSFFRYWLCVLLRLPVSHESRHAHKWVISHKWVTFDIWRIHIVIIITSPTLLSCIFLYFLWRDSFFCLLQHIHVCRASSYV